MRREKNGEMQSDRERKRDGGEEERVPGLQRWSYQLTPSILFSANPTIAGDSWAIGDQLDELSAKGREKEREKEK